MEDHNIEKRKYARLDIKSNLTFSILETLEGEAPAGRFRGKGKNIGVEGLLFTSDTRLSNGTILDMEVFLPNREDPVYTKGEVRWCRISGDPESKEPYSIGVKFLDIDNTHVLMLIKYVCGNLTDTALSKLKKKPDGF